MLGAFALSMLISASTTYLLYLALRQYYRSYVYMEDPLAGWRHWMAEIGDLNVFLMIFIPQSIIMFYLITRPYVKYFNNISEGIHHLASGNFTHKVELSTNDELQQIADDINRAAEKLQEATRRGDVAEQSKDQLIMNLAHDLRTPLTSVIGYLSYILQHDTLDQERSKHYTTIAYAKSKRLESLIEQLFEITRMNYGHITLHHEPIDIGELLTQLVEEMSPMFEAHHVQGRIQLDGDLNLNADGELLARVFENLLSNAARYGSDGLYIDVTVERQADNIVIEVTNYGAMIEEEDMKHLFDLFYKGDRSRTHQEGNSTGLGLYIAKNIIEQHGGSIGVGSDVTRTSFTITLPVGVGSNVRL